ncbi:hydroxyacid dehydrogenase [Aerococcus agrisoli]|uniref:Hydroxyacid dehydrogenase n=1 Tax=Aerococcus agrisoli TaxID=2487350 RepID=A0A3N4GLA1_9LACT|nr:D-isomer specific 2-hydroxyacid dehydrogenase family protein [Aerococcus agrisoli]RPA63689.1 hydroxyacid dehydrogenase [Aerococcus agrisoli]
MAEHKIAIVNSSSFGRIFEEHISELQKIGQVERFEFDQKIPGRELAEALNGYNMIIASVTPFFDEEFFKYKDELKLISRHGIGYNNVDLEAAKAHNTLVTIIPALVEREAVAEQNITNLLNIMRRVNESSAAVRNDKWKNRAQYIGNSLFNKTIGLIGIGNTGSCMAEILRLGFRCKVIAYDPYKSNLDIERFGAEKVSLDYLLMNADVICLAANLTDESFNIINESAISKMKDRVYISNSARGALVNEMALVKGLKSGKIAGYATDVLEVEPGGKNHPYLQFNNVIITPHTGAYTQECLKAMGDKCVDDVKRVSINQMPVRAIQSKSMYVTN